MKAVVYETYGEPNVLTVTEVPKPSINSGEVLVKVRASGINPVDTYFRKGIRPVESFPHIPHFDIAGEVVEVGSTVNSVQIGDRIWATNAKGASAEYVAISADLVFPLPADNTFEEGAAIAMPFMTAYLSLFNRGHLQSNESVLIFGGAGAVGHAAIQLAKNAGAHVIATASTDAKASIAKAAGADDVIIYQTQDLITRVKELTRDVGVSLILDMSLSENMENDLEMIKVGGRIITVGSPVNNTPPLPWRKLNMKHASLTGVFLFTAPKNELIQAGTAITEGFSTQSLNAHIGKTYSFQEAAKAHVAVEEKEYDGRVILTHF